MKNVSQKSLYPFVEHKRYRRLPLLMNRDFNMGSTKQNQPR